MNIIEIGRLTDGEAREYLERLRWPNGPVCPHCGSQDAVRENMDRSATVMTDELSAYTGIGREFDGGHEVVNHDAKQYSRRRKNGKNVNTNTAESFFALLKRGHYSVFHRLSKRHLHRYCAEFGFRWNHRKVSDAEPTDAEPTDAVIRQAEGRRLTYEAPAGCRDVPA